jgi:hypothetical protein
MLRRPKLSKNEVVAPKEEEEEENHSKRVAAYPLLRPHGHRDWLKLTSRVGNKRKLRIRTA